MDKVVDHMLVFNGQADIRDFPGNYTQYRDWKEEKARLEKEKEKEASKPQEDKTAKVRLNEKRRMSFFTKFQPTHGLFINQIRDLGQTL